MFFFLLRSSPPYCWYLWMFGFFVVGHRPLLCCLFFVSFLFAEVALQQTCLQNNSHHFVHRVVLHFVLPCFFSFDFSLAGRVLLCLVSFHCLSRQHFFQPFVKVSCCQRLFSCLHVAAVLVEVPTLPVVVVVVVVWFSFWICWMFCIFCFHSIHLLQSREDETAQV